MRKFKTLRFKSKTKRYYLGYFAHILNEGLGGCNIPVLMGIDKTMEDLKYLYPKHDFKCVELMIMKLKSDR